MCVCVCVCNSAKLSFRPKVTSEISVFIFS